MLQIEGCLLNLVVLRTLLELCLKQLQQEELLQLEATQEVAVQIGVQLLEAEGLIEGQPLEEVLEAEVLVEVLLRLEEETKILV